MDIAFEKTEPTLGLIKVTINKDDFQPGVDQKLKDYSKKANIKGFRPGKVPIGMVRNLYGKALIVEEINKILGESLSNYLKESEIQFLGDPLPQENGDSYDWDSQEVFNFNYEVGYADSFEVKLDKKVRQEKYLIKVDDSVLSETIENLQRQFGEQEQAEAIGERDVVYAELESTITLFDKKEIAIELRDIEKAAVKKFLGLKADEKLEIDLQKVSKNPNFLPSVLRVTEDEAKQLKGKQQLTIKAITHYKLAEINQELFDKTFGEGNITSEEEFNAKVSETVGTNYKVESERFLDFKLKEKLVEAANITLPDTFLKKWLVKTNENMTEEMVELEYNSYASEMKWSLVRNKVIQDQSIKVEHEDVMNEAKELIKQQFGGANIGDQLNDQLDTFANNYLQAENGQNYMNVFNQVQTKKAFEYIKEAITIKEKEVTLEEFRKL